MHDRWSELSFVIIPQCCTRHSSSFDVVIILGISFMILDRRLYLVGKFLFQHKSCSSRRIIIATDHHLSLLLHLVLITRLSIDQINDHSTSRLVTYLFFTSFHHFDRDSQRLILTFSFPMISSHQTIMSDFSYSCKLVILNDIFLA